MICASLAGVVTGLAHAVPAHTKASGTFFAALESNIARAAPGIDPVLLRLDPILITIFPGR